jgi:hypothetical protein
LASKIPIVLLLWFYFEHADWNLVLLWGVLSSASSRWVCIQIFRQLEHLLLFNSTFQQMPVSL